MEIANNVEIDLEDLKYDPENEQEEEEKVEKPKRNNKKFTGIVPDDVQTRLNQIELYYIKFPHLKETVKKPRQLEAKSKEWLDNFVNVLDRSIDKDGNNDFLKYIYAGTMNTVETVACANDFPVHGMTQNCMLDPSIDMQLKRLEIKYLANVNQLTDPEVLLLLYTAMIVNGTYNNNVKREKIKKQTANHLSGHMNNPFEFTDSETE